jgi:hypothetical protein
MTDIWLKLTGNQVQARAAFVVMGMDKEMLHDGGLAGFNHHVATLFHPNLMTQYATKTTPAVFSGPYLMMRLVSDTVRAKALEKIIDSPAMPAGLELVSEADLFPFGPMIMWAD